MEFTDEHIKKVLAQYLKVREYKKEYYNTRYHNDEKYREKSKERAKEYYQLNKDKRKKKYDDNAEYIKYKRNLRYARETDNMENFIKKYKDKHNLYNLLTEEEYNINQ